METFCFLAQTRQSVRFLKITENEIENYIRPVRDMVNYQCPAIRFVSIFFRIFFSLHFEMSKTCHWVLGSNRPIIFRKNPPKNHKHPCIFTKMICYHASEPNKPDAEACPFLKYKKLGV